MSIVAETSRNYFIAYVMLGLQPLACWDCGFESRRGHGCLSVVSVACCQVEFSAAGRSLVQRSPTDCGVSVCDQMNTNPLHLTWLGRKRLDWERLREVLISWCICRTNEVYNAIFILISALWDRIVLSPCFILQRLYSAPQQLQGLWSRSTFHCKVFKQPFRH
jgi:hypothetical protein